MGDSVGLTVGGSCTGLGADGACLGAGTDCPDFSAQRDFISRVQLAQSFLPVGAGFPHLLHTFALPELLTAAGIWESSWPQLVQMAACSVFSLLQFGHLIFSQPFFMK